MQTRKLIALFAIVTIVTLVGAWLYSLAGSAAQLRSTLRPANAARPNAPTRAAVPTEPVPSLAVKAPPPTVPDTSAATTIVPDEQFAEEDAFDEPQAGPIGAAAFAELLDSGLLDENSDPAAAGELRETLRSVASGEAE